MTEKPLTEQYVPDRSMPAAALVDSPELPPKQRRTRALLVLVIVASVCLSYLAGWMYWAQTHVVTRYEQVPAGETVRSEGIDFRLTKMTRSYSLSTSEEGAEGATAQPNTVFVVAEMEVVVSDEADPDYPVCVVVLVGPDGRTWEYDGLNAPTREVPTTCSDAPRNEPYTIEQIFVVPEKYADQLAGLAVADYTGAPEKVIRPPVQ